MSTPYTPQPGTIPARVIAHLKTLPVGAELTTAELCEEIGQSVTAGFGACVSRLVQAGMLASRKAGSGLLYWSLGDGVPLAPPALDDDPDDKPAPAPATAAGLMSAWRPARSVFDLAGASSGQAKPEAEPDHRPALDALFTALLPGPTNQPDEEERAAYLAAIGIDEQPDDSFAVALWSDGRLQLQQVDEEMVLSVEQTRVLVAYLERMGEAAA